MAAAISAAGVVLALWSRDRVQLAEAESFRHRAILSQARGQYAKGEREAALATIQPILESRHAGAEAQLLQAGVLVDDGRLKEATAMLGALLTERPEVAGAAHSLLARVLWESESLNAKKLKEIEDHRRQAEVLLPETAEAYFLRAMTAITIKEQLAALDKALLLDPDHYESLRLRAFTYYASRKYEKMKDDALLMTHLRSKGPLGYCLRAMAWHQLGRFSEAVAEYDRALELIFTTDPQYVELNGRRCEALMRMGQYERVLADAQECLRNAPKATVLQSQVFCSLTALGRYEEARALMQSIVESPDSGGADDQVQLRSMKHVLDTLTAGGRWHPPDRKPEGPVFFYMREADEMYRGLCVKAHRLVTDCFAARWSPDGTKVAFAQGLPGYSGVAVYDLVTKETDLLTVPGKDPSWSPDGRHIAFVRDAQALRLSELTTGQTRGRSESYVLGEEVWVMKADGSEPRRLARRAHGPSWSTDAQRVYYKSSEDPMLYWISIEDIQAQPVPVCVCSVDFPALSPQGDYVANVDGGTQRGAVLRIVDLATQSCIAEWPTPLVSSACSWSPDERELSLGGLSGIRARTGLWIYDLTKKEAVKVLSGHISGASWSLDRTRLLFSLRVPYWETWVADLDPNLPTAESLRPVQTLEEHCLESIATCTRGLEADPDSFVDRWTRVTSALWIGHPQAPVYLQELDLRLGRPPLRSSAGNARAAQNILACPSLCERLEPLAFVMARRAVEQQPGHAKELAPMFEGTGQHEHAAQLLQIAQADTP